MRAVSSDEPLWILPVIPASHRVFLLCIAVADSGGGVEILFQATGATLKLYKAYTQQVQSSISNGHDQEKEMCSNKVLGTQSTLKTLFLKF